MKNKLKVEQIHWLKIHNHTKANKMHGLKSIKGLYFVYNM